KTTVEVGETLAIDISHLDQMPAERKKALAQAFDVPLGVISRFVEGSATQTALTADQFAKDLRVTHTDYKYLLKKWDEYHPPAEGEKPKQEGLKALAIGDVNKAWELYAGLRKPPP